MSVQRGQPETLSRSDQEGIESHADEIVALPDGEFSRSAVDPRLARFIDSFRTKEYLVTVTPSGDRADGLGAVWRVDPDVREYAERYVAGRDAICPCGHGGVSNHGDRYQCTAAHCDRVFCREQLADDATVASREGATPHWTSIQFWQSDGCWRATEPHADNQLVGQGDDRYEAMMSYVCQLRERDSHE